MNNLIEKLMFLLFIFLLLSLEILLGKNNPLASNQQSMILEAKQPQLHQKKLVILKLDDLVAGTDNHPVSYHWQKVTDYLRQKHIKAAFGIIGYSLTKDNSAYFKWIRNVTKSGYVEFWNHGFRNRTNADSLGEFEVGYLEQLRALRMTDSLAKVKVGINIIAWGPHWSSTNENTDQALLQTPQIRVTFGYPPKVVHYTGIVLPRKMDMEYPTHNPNFEAFLKAYSKKQNDLDYFFLQGHPDSWDSVRWDNFIRIIEFLQSEKVHFVTPSELVDILKKQSKLPHKYQR